MPFKVFAVFLSFIVTSCYIYCNCNQGVWNLAAEKNEKKVTLTKMKEYIIIVGERNLCTWLGKAAL